PRRLAGEEGARRAADGGPACGPDDRALAPPDDVGVARGRSPGGRTAGSPRRPARAFSLPARRSWVPGASPVRPHGRSALAPRPPVAPLTASEESPSPATRMSLGLRPVLHTVSIFTYGTAALWINRIEADRPYTIGFALRETTTALVGLNPRGSAHLAGPFGE